MQDVIIVREGEKGVVRGKAGIYLLALFVILLGSMLDSSALQWFGAIGGLLHLAAYRHRSGVLRTPQQAADHLAITYGVKAGRPVWSGRIIDVEVSR